MASESATFKLRFWGVRGSIPTPGPATLRYGGNTSCVELDIGNRLIIVDCGSGIRVLGDELLKRQSVEAAIFFTHFHWDHIQGFPFFTPAFVDGNTFDIYGERKLNTNITRVLQGQMMFPNFPVSLQTMSSTMRFHEVDVGKPFELESNVEVHSADLNHPGGSLSLRFQYAGRSVVTAWDTEHYDKLDASLIKHAEGADLLIYDATYTNDEYNGADGSGSKVGWGHSTWQEAVKLAEAAAVKKLVLFHHDPSHHDALLDEIGVMARKAFPHTVLAYEGMEIDLLGESQA